MDLGLDRAFRPVEGLGNLGDAQSVDVSKDDRGPNGRRQPLERSNQLTLRLAPGSGRFGGKTAIDWRVEPGVEHRLERARRVSVIEPAASIAREVDRDRREPGP
jgi:hypothetical protein